MNFSNGSTFVVAGNTTTSDEVSLTTGSGGVTIGTGVTMSLTETGTPGRGTSYLLLNLNTGETISGTFSNIPAAGSVVLSGITFTSNYQSTPNGALTLTVPSIFTWTWTGGGLTANFSDPLNWVNGSGGHGTPANGDSLLFNTVGTAAPTANNDESSLSVAGLNFASGSVGYTLTGNPLTLSAASSGLTDTSGNQTLNLTLGTATNAQSINVTAGCQVALAGGVSFSSAVTLGGGGTVVIDGTDGGSGCTVTVNAGTLQLGNGTGVGTVNGSLVDNSNVVFDNGAGNTVSNAISGTGNVTAAGANLTLTGNNTYSGNTTVTSNTLIAFAASGAALGCTANVQVGNGASLEFINNAQINNAAVVNVAATGTLNVNDATEGIDQLTGTGSVVLGSSSAGNLSVGVAGGTSEFDGAVSGDGVLTKAGLGNFTLTANATNSGGATVNGGNLVLGNGTADIGMAASIADNAGVILNTATDETLTFTFTGSGNLTKAGSGNLTLDQTSFGGAVTVSGGGLNVPATLTVTGGVVDNGLVTVAGCLAGGTATVGNSGCLTGSGTVAAAVSVSNGGILSGNLTLSGASLSVASGGTVDPGFGNAGTMTISAGTVASFASGAVINYQVAGNTAGSTYDQLVINGGQTVSVNGVVLNVTDVGGYVPTAPTANTTGDHLVLINNNGSGALTGNMVLSNLATLSNGAGLTVGTSGMRLFYNDSTLGASQDLILAQQAALANVTYTTQTFATYNGANDGQYGLQASVICSLVVTYSAVVDSPTVAVQHITAGSGGTGSVDAVVGSQIISQVVVGEQTVLVIDFTGVQYNAAGTATVAPTLLYSRGNNGGQYSLNNGWYDVDTTAVDGNFNGSASGTVARHQRGGQVLPHVRRLRPHGRHLRRRRDDSRKGGGQQRLCGLDQPAEWRSCRRRRRR